MANKSDAVVASTATPVTEVLVESPVSAPIALSLHEFCARLSSRITKPELIAGFEHTERAEGRLSDTDAAFTSRFDVFVSLPV